MGSQPLDSTRPDAEPTINEAGQQGFAIDGTDSFSVPGPADGLPPDPGDEDAMARIAAMRRLLVTLGAAVAVLLVVIIVGRTGGSGQSDRLAGATEGPAFTLPSPFGDPTSRGGVDRKATTEADATFPTYDDEFASPSSQTETSQYDDFQYEEGTFPSYTVTSDPFSDDQFDDQFDDDYDLPYVPTRTTPRTFPRYTPPVFDRSRPPVPGDDETEETDPEDTTQETDPPTTPETTAATTTTSTTTTTTTTLPPAPVSAWKAPTTALGVVCGDQVRLWADHQSVLAGIGTARVWRSTDGGAAWTPITVGGPPTAYADDPTDPETAWVATSAGVFKIHGGDVPAATGDLANVTSLSATGTDASSTLIAVSDGQVQRWVDAAPGWTPTAALPVGAVPGEVLALDGDSFVVGTDDGIFRSDGGGPWVAPPGASAGVVGAAVRTDATTLYWLRANHAGVLRSIDDGATWAPVLAAGIATDAGSLMFVPSLGLVTTGANSPLVSSLDGSAWVPFKDQPPFRPDGIARAGSGAGTTVWTSKCGQAGQPAAADAVLRLADSGP